MVDYNKNTWQDEVKDQNGNIIQAGTPLSATNMNNLEAGADIGANVAGVVALLAMQHINGVEKDLDKWKKQRLQQGTAYIYNKYVIEGCVISKMINSRYLQVSRSGTYTAGDMSRVHIDGKRMGIIDEQMVAMVPLGTGANKDYYVYADWDSVAGRYRIYLVADAVPAGKLGLYKATVPGSDQGTDLTAVTLTDIRRIESNSAFHTTDAFVLVSNPGYTLYDAPEYDVQLTIEEASDFQRVGDLIVYEKASNGFKVKFTGDADNVKIRWTIINPDVI